MNLSIFREYDIRGVAERDFPEAFVVNLGDGLAAHFRARGVRTVTVGQDCRLSSPRIARVIKERLTAGGLEILDVGLCHSPGLYFSVFHFETEGGVMITASHNPSEDNGFKIVRGRTTIYGAEIQELKDRVIAAHAGAQADPIAGPGSVREVDLRSPYVANLTANIKLGPRRPKVVVDAGNGPGGLFLLPILKNLGIDADALFCEPDGRFPNHHPDPTVPENMQKLIARVRETGAEAGLALDGDADRLGVVDARGRIVWGDQLMILFAREILKNRPGATFVSEVKCSQALYDQIEAAGGRAIMWKVGHSLIKKKMKEENAVLAGEMSGHIFFADRYFGFDDAVYAAARLVELLSHDTRSLSELVDTLPVVFNTPEVRLDCPDAVKFEVVRRAVAHFQAIYPVNDIDGARVTFPGGWGLVRASNTGPVVVMRCEADSPARLAEIRTEVEHTLSRLRADVESQTGPP